MHGTVTYFIITQKKVVELKVVSTCNQASSDQASAEVVSKFWPDKYMARTLLCVYAHAHIESPACRYHARQVRKLTDDFSEGDTRANSIAYLIAFTMGFEVTKSSY